MNKRGLHRFLFPVCSVIAGLIIVCIFAEIFLRLLGIGYGNAPLISDANLHHAHPPNYSFIAHDPRGEFGGHKVYYDENGLVSDPDKINKEQKNTPYRIAFMGDSFVEATQVAYSDSFVGLLESSSKHISTIKNYGVTSYSPIFYLLQWRYKVKHFKPTHVFVLLYNNDIATDFEMTKAAIYSDDGEIIRLPGPGNDWFTRQLRKSYLIRYIRKTQLHLMWVINHWKDDLSNVAGEYLEENPDISDLSSDLLLTLSKEVEQSGAQFILMAVPSKYRLTAGEHNISELKHSDKWKKWAKMHNIQFIDLVELFRSASKNGQNLFFKKDIHFNYSGHKLVAGRLLKAFPDIFIN